MGDQQPHVFVEWTSGSEVALEQDGSDSRPEAAKGLVQTLTATTALIKQS